MPKTPHGPLGFACRFNNMIETKTLTKTVAADNIFWAVVTVPVVIFATAKTADYALKRVKRKSRS
jgi:hypothetical protein